MTDVKYMPVNEFREMGYLQEVNRRFLHPLGLALAVRRTTTAGGQFSAGVWDCRDDPEGIVHEDVDQDKAQNVYRLWRERKRARVEKLGYMVQPAVPVREEVGSDIAFLIGKSVAAEFPWVNGSEESWQKVGKGILDRVCEWISEEPYLPEQVTPEEIHLMDLIMGPEATAGIHSRAETLNILLEEKANSFEEYESIVAPLSAYPGQGTVQGLAYTALGVAGEAGEFADKVKKVLRDDNGLLDPERVEAMKYELGDVLWYVAAAARELGSSLAEIAVGNVTKLLGRRSRNTIHGDGDYR